MEPRNGSAGNGVEERERGRTLAPRAIEPKIQKKIHTLQRTTVNTHKTFVFWETPGGSAGERGTELTSGSARNRAEERERGSAGARGTELKSGSAGARRERGSARNRAKEREREEPS